MYYIVRTGREWPLPYPVGPRSRAQFYLGHDVTEFFLHPTEAPLLGRKRTHPENRLEVYPLPLYLVQGVEGIVQNTELYLRQTI